MLVKKKNFFFSEFITINNNYEEISESQTNTAANETVLSSQISNKSNLHILLAQYLNFFQNLNAMLVVKRMELHRINLNFRILHL